MVKYTNKNYSIKKYETDVKLIKEIKEWSISFSPFKDKEKKIKILKEIFGYKHLIGNCGSFLLLEECDGMRISVVLKKEYAGAQKRIENLGKPLLEEKQKQDLVIQNNFQEKRNLYDRETHNGLEIKIKKSTGQGFLFD